MALVLSQGVQNGMDHSTLTIYLLSKKLSECSLYFHSLGSDVISDHFFWSEYRVNRTRFPSLTSEFSLYLSLLDLEASEIYSSTSEICLLH